MSREPWKGLSFDVPSKAVIASDGKGRGVVLAVVGAQLRFEMEEAGLYALDELGLDDAPAGLSVWEGSYVWTSAGEWEVDGEMVPSSTSGFRPLTPAEWRAVEAGRCPWGEVGICFCREEPFSECPTHAVQSSKRGGGG